MSSIVNLISNRLNRHTFYGGFIFPGCENVFPHAIGKLHQVSGTKQGVFSIYPPEFQKLFLLRIKSVVE